MTRIIVCETGPLLHLSDAGAVHLLSLAGKVLIPPLVATEFEATTHGWNPPQWVQVVGLENPCDGKLKIGARHKGFTLAKPSQLV